MENIRGSMDIGARVGFPAEVFSHLTDELYECKIVCRMEKYGNPVRTSIGTAKAPGSMKTPICAAQKKTGWR